MQADTAPVAGQPELSFGGLLRQLRAKARLTQEELAEAAGISPRSVSDLERRVNLTAHKDTALRLARALDLDGPARDSFVAAARGRGPTDAVLAARKGWPHGAFAAMATKALPRDIAAFIGRKAELARLAGAIDGLAASNGVVAIHAIDGMAGIGKTTFAVHAAHQLADSYPDGQFFLPLHAHSPGQRPVDPADGLASLLLAAGVSAPYIPAGLEARAARWRDYAAGKRILLVLDDAAGHEQVRPLLPGTAGSLVLVTSRRRLTALTDTTVISLDVLPAAEAADLLVGLASRPGLTASDAAVGEITRLCGSLPLAIGMLASRLRHHPAWTAEALAVGLASARDRLAMMRAENLSVGAAFDLSYADLTGDQQRLFRRLGLMPGSSFDAYAAAALDQTNLSAARNHLDELYDQHLLTEPEPGRYQLHDLLREHARALAAADDPGDGADAVERLLDYYLHTALAAGRHFASRVSVYRRRPAGSPPTLSPELSVPGQAAAWLETELPNLHAAADYAVTSGRHSHAIQIAAAMSGFLTARGHWHQSAAIHQTTLTAARQAADRLGEADTLSALSRIQEASGDYPAATASLARALELYREAADLPGQASTLPALGFLRTLAGDYAAAKASSQQALALARTAGDRPTQVDALQELGLVQQLTGDYLAAAASFQNALELCRELGPQAEAYSLNCLGMLQQEICEYPAATASQLQALKIFRDLADPLGQAVVLNDLGLVQQETGDYSAAADSHQQALAVFRDFGHRLGQAEALNRLGELSSRTSAMGQACDYHTQAQAIARDLGVPLEEARAVEGIGRSHLQNGNSREAATYLRQALAIYQRIGAQRTRRVHETLLQHGL